MGEAKRRKQLGFGTVPVMGNEVIELEGPIDARKPALQSYRAMIQAHNSDVAYAYKLQMGGYQMLGMAFCTIARGGDIEVGLVTRGNGKQSNEGMIRQRVKRLEPRLREQVANRLKQDIEAGTLSFA